MTKQKKNERIQQATYVDKNKNERYKKYMKYHRGRVNMQRAIRKITSRRHLLSNTPWVSREQTIKDANKLMSFKKSSTIKKITNHVDLLTELKVHFWNMCSIANYEFPPGNFDHDIAVFCGQEPPAQPSISATPPEQHAQVKFFLMNILFTHKD